MMRYALWDALTRDPIDTDLRFNRTAWSVHIDAPHTITGTLIQPDPDLLNTLIPAGQILTMHSGNDILFSGFLTRVTTTTNDTDVTINATSWTGYPHRVIHGRDQAWTRTDPGIIINELWAHTLSFDGAPNGINYWYTRTPLRIGDIATGTEGETNYQPADPWRAAWYLGTNIGTAINELSALAAITHTEHHLLDYNNKPFTEIHAEFDTQPRYPDAMFIHGENITAPVTLDINGQDVATSVLALGAGQGPTRRVGDAWHTKNVLRSVYHDTEAPGDSTSSALKARAHRLLQRLSDPMPASSVEVLKDHATAQAGTWRAGDIVQLELPSRRWWVRVTGIDWGAENDPTATVHIARGRD